MHGVKVDVDEFFFFSFFLVLFSPSVFFARLFSANDPNARAREKLKLPSYV